MTIKLILKTILFLPTKRTKKIATQLAASCNVGVNGTEFCPASDTVNIDDPIVTHVVYALSGYGELMFGEFVFGETTGSGERPVTPDLITDKEPFPCVDTLVF
ncbi:hypothetical protein, partial [Sansalvadorimonas verongulae]|uniref:hypothetical protein n=1 Tax=Sansalvadorimonas verongulae TaxID=2172824 RepID=UPI0012BC7385